MAEWLFEAIVTLEGFPARCPIVPEAAELGYPARHLLFGKGTGLYRIVFYIIEEDRHVRVLRIWHGSRDALNSVDPRSIVWLSANLKRIKKGRTR